MAKNWANANELWADVIAETLHRKGIAYAVTCPGSRSSPLTFAFARHAAIEAIPVLDERSAGFFALGLAKRTGKPVAIVCTSGSAVANFFPAVVEASESGVPLLVLTADRPAELRDCAAGQTIDQVKLFGGYVRKQVELAVPEASLELLRYVRQTVAHSVDVATASNRGPVHLNIPFRDPLIPVAQADFVAPFGADDFASYFSHLEPSDALPLLQAMLPAAIRSVQKGLILVGPASPVNEEAWCENVAALANGLGWPVLSDALNPIRTNASSFTSLVCGYESVLRNAELAEGLRPEHVILLGGFPTSKALRSWIGEADVPITILSDRPVNLDATHSRATQVYADFEFTGVIVEKGDAADYAERWLALDRQVNEAFEARFSGTEELFEAKLAWTLSKALPEGSSLCVSNSMPPRDMEFYFGRNDLGISIFSSRGANGIDGILSTAMGVAHEGEETFLLTGDLALLHDSNGALIAKDLKGSLTVLLVNNAGGGIFEMLPVSQFEDVFEKHYGTDQKVDFANWARTYGIGYELVESWADLEEKLEEAPNGVRVLEIRTDRKRDAAWRKQWFAEVSRELW
ncbi:2-succinyl-5-enolpyruvyl-6-hydroxy-3-cyclohexene-1-carboxylic-acid synthase [Pelagicoccus sp. SDUM812005]|uniref:2-succinyl-5-enolpyruvyl-6-hydroxy-3- cyclohexene-1-carboxylic-acid synthase n=1 Tax=Pelagicoccus sp. SDUM812005 TaxID=3041257 RepID=UPI00280FC345|nr:2-succinyl-5-enolpyruvyl-6-hydroxy-3-cyclohexene-1-carboxylic-acid synthase [Pelagicoccus sp. SDUM812005]MDQ8179815.1 2-succinyl-5-enolpyruvyl-6-hydroxy-3-cyclohexene-1-carboxylic-acid synthase [Pelagicoccus sp. SDUM812005]